MADYLKSTNFATKDALPSGNPGKIVKGTEIDTEFNAIADAVESKADLLNPVFSGLLTTDTLATTGAANIGGALSAAGNFAAAADAQFNSTGRLLFPRGTTAQRPSSPTAGSTRWNTDLGYLENYTGTEWRPVGYVTPADVSDKVNTSTGYFQVPVGTVAQRPASPAEGLIRYNSEVDIYEGYINGNWHKFNTTQQGQYTVSYVIVAGGGSGGDVGGGGGGAGGMLVNTFTGVPGASYSIVIGAGGAGQLGYGTNGSNSYITGIATATGGGSGGSQAGAGGNGGSGGGTNSGYYGYNPGTGIPGQGNNGGGSATSGTNSAGGGGGAGAAGNSASYGVGGAGGAGLVTTITGTTLYLAGGGGGYGDTTNGSGGAGGGGGAGSTGSPGTVSTGGGGGGTASGPSVPGGNGGSGVVYLSVPTDNFSGTYTGLPTITTNGSNTVLKFTNSGSYTC